VHSRGVLAEGHAHAQVHLQLLHHRGGPVAPADHAGGGDLVIFEHDRARPDLGAFAKRLVSQGVTLISTGGTARALREAGLEVAAVEDVTGFPEMMDGRVKTLHPLIHGGLLGLRDEREHVEAMKQHGIESIDLVCVNLYPFEQTVAREGVDDAEAIENIDIGGPSMTRSAAKNHRFVTVVTDPSQYDRVATAMEQNEGATPLDLRRDLAMAAFARTAAYDTAVAEWMSRRFGGNLPPVLLNRFEKHPVELRYGENPHQAGAVYRDPKSREASLVAARQLHGKALSFNNFYDGNGALELVKEIDAKDQAGAAVIKHANPCGFAVAEHLADAFDKAYAGDPLAAFGGIVAFNRSVDADTAQRIAEGEKFLEVIIAPDFDEPALRTLADRWANVRLLATGPLPAPEDRDKTEIDAKRIVGGMLVQQRDLTVFDAGRWTHQAGPAPDAATLKQARLAMIAVKHVKSNAITIARDEALVGAGAGQMDRVAACRLAAEKAGDRARGAAAASDAFFPFRDGPDVLIQAGVAAVVQPGGSKRDEQTIAACNEANVTLLFTGQRHFRH